MKIITFLKKYSKEICVLSLLIILFYSIYTNTESFQNDITDAEIKTAFDNLMNDYSKIFKDKNRNAGGVQFFHHIVNMNLNKDEFELYNTFYCGVSGSPIDPSRSDIYDYTIVKDLQGNDIYGKYYRCCFPCVCDIMKYAKVDKYDANLNDTCVTYDVLTIEDPCCNPTKMPPEVSSFVCKNNQTQNGILSRNGRLIFALFYDTKIVEDIEEDEDKQKIADIRERCTERINTEPQNLKYGMGDIFANLSLVCNSQTERFNVEDTTHPSLKNIYGEPLKPCKTGTSSGSWDSQGYCSEKGGGVHQICMNVTQDTKDFSTKTGQSKWSEDRIGNNHCMCLGAWALYKAKNEGNDNELVCDSIPEMALNIDYVDKWNTWNKKELSHQIIKGVDSKVKQCYDKKKSNHLKHKYDKLRNHYNRINTNQKWDSII